MSNKYLRQILLQDFGGQSQKKLEKSHIALIGLGGVGAPASLYLVGAGIGKLTIYEDDEVDVTNLHRQVIYREASIGAPKALAGSNALRELNSDVEIKTAGRFENPDSKTYDLILDGSDNLKTRHAVSRYALQHQIPLLSASLSQWEGQISHFRGKPCYACLYPENTDQSALPSCAEAGVIGAVAGQIGTMAALEAIKILTGINPLAPGEMLLVDGKHQETRRIKISASSNCPQCA